MRLDQLYETIFKYSGNMDFTRAIEKELTAAHNAYDYSEEVSRANVVVSLLKKNIPLSDILKAVKEHAEGVLLLLKSEFLEQPTENNLSELSKIVTDEQRQYFWWEEITFFTSRKIDNDAIRRELVKLEFGKWYDKSLLYDAIIENVLKKLKSEGIKCSFVWTDDFYFKLQDIATRKELHLLVHCKKMRTYKKLLKRLKVRIQRSL